MDVSPTALGTLTNGYARTTRVSMPCPSSSGAITVPSTSMLATRDKEEEDWIFVRSGAAGIGVESQVQEQQDSRGLPRPTIERRATV